MEDSGKTSSGAADSYIGSLISLTSKSEIRYEGLLASINTEESSIGLQNVRSYGTEGRKKDGQQIPPSDKIYEYILFRGKDIKDLQVKYTPAAHNTPELHHDPAIIQQSHFSEGPLDSRGFSSLGTAMTSMPYHEGYMSSHIAGSNSFTAPSIQDGNPSLSLLWHGCDRPSNGIPYTSCSQEPPLQHSLIHPSIHLSSSVSGLVDPPPLTAYGISTKVPASLLPKPDLTANSLNRLIIPHSLGYKLHHSEVHPSATFNSPTSGVANASALPVMPSDNLLYNNLPSMSASVQSDISSTFSITPTKVPETSLLESELVTNSIRVSPPTYGQEVNAIASPFQNNGWYAPVTNPAVWSMPKSETSNESSMSGPSALGLSMLTPGQCLQPSAFNDSLLQSFDNDKESREAIVPSSSKMSSFVSTLNTQQTLPSTPICSDKQNQLKAMEYAEEFDFVAMNEKFKKEEVWGTLGKVMQKTLGGRNENDVDELFNENDGAQFTKFSNRAVYVKDEFFDSISCGSLDRARRNQHGRFSERTKVDTERPYTGRGRGYLANYRGAYYRGRGYRHGWRGRGEDGVGEQG